MTTQWNWNFTNGFTFSRKTSYISTAHYIWNDSIPSKCMKFMLMTSFWLTGWSCSTERATHRWHLRVEEQGDGLPGPDPGSEARKPESFHRWEIWIFYEQGMLLNNPRIVLCKTNILWRWWIFENIRAFGYELCFFGIVWD